MVLDAAAKNSPRSAGASRRCVASRRYASWTKPVAIERVAIALASQPVPGQRHLPLLTAIDVLQERTSAGNDGALGRMELEHG